MKTKVRVCSVISALVMAHAGLAFAQASPPPNDNFSNRIVLAGPDVSFDGTLAGATMEVIEIIPQPYVYLRNSVTETVWWDWTAPESETALIQISNSQPSLDNDAIAVYTGNDISSGQLIAATSLDTRFPDMFLAFEAVAGTDYKIQLAGSDGESFHFRLLSTNSPYIIEQPRSQTITTGDSVLFTVIAASGLTKGLPGSPKGYQWQFNGTNLPGETTPMLALDSPDASQAGPYQVVITNATGAVTSQVATLWMTPNDTAPALRSAPVLTNNQFGFSILGDLGRRYRILSSTNLGNWLPEASFPTPTCNDSGNPQMTSVVVDWTGADSFALLRTAPVKLMRASPYHAQNEVCNNHLKQVRFALALDAYENHRPYDYPPAVNANELGPYFNGGQLPVCPAGGTYNVVIQFATPSCTIQGHVLEEP